MTQEPQTDSLATRRGVLAGVGLVGLASAITACGGGGSSSTAAAAPATTPAAPATGAASTAASSAAASSAASQGASSAAVANALATTSEIPVGSGKVFSAQQVVVTQPTAGEFKAFSAVCTHMGCIVNQISDGTIDCPCHGSKYSIKDGSVVNGPAASPLPPVAIKVDGPSIVQG